MDCRLSFKNASTLDKLCSVFKSPYLVIDTRKGVNLQLVSESKNIVSNLTLNFSFFEECQIKNLIIKINKPKFSYTKMLSLRIEFTKSFLIFEYEFQNYFYRHRYVIFDGSLYQVPYKINRSDYIDSFLLYQVISQTNGQAKIKFDETSSEVYNENIHLKFQCTGFSGINFSFDSNILKNILSNNDLFDSCLLNWEDDDSPINLNFYEMQENEINLEEFIKDRESDIKILEKAINSSKKKTMLFQRLPFYNRRRTRSNFVKNKKSTRQKHRFFLKTHIWYAKRFKMIKVENIGLPIQRNQKSSKYIYKSQDRGFLFDESFKQIRIYKISNKIINFFKCDKNIKNKIQICKTEKGHVEIIITDTYFFLICSFFNYEDESAIKILECTISCIKIDENKLKNISTNIEESLESCNPFFVFNTLEYETGKIFLMKKDVMNTWNMLIKEGCIPISIDELQRLALENSYMTYPFDDVNSEMYKKLENVQNIEFIKKYERTPKSKKVAINFDDLWVYTDKQVFYCNFELEKGVLERNGFIFDTNDVIIGRIIRGGFCYTRGKSRGLCYFYEEINIDDTFIGKNYNNDNKYKLKIIKKIQI